MNATITTQNIADMFFPIFKAYDINRAILFGSVAKGTSNSQSDIDIFVDSQLKGLRFVGLLEELKNVAERDIDLINSTHIESGSAVDLEIQKTGVVIYEK